MSDSSPVPSRHLATLYEITRKLNSSLDLQNILNYVMDRVIEVTGAERGFLMLHDQNTDNLDFRVARNIDQTDLDKPKFQVSRTIVNHVAETGLPLLTDNAQDAFSEHQSVVMMSLRSILCVPITVRNRFLGLVYVDNRIHAGVFNAEHLELVTAFASQAGVSIENARLYEMAIETGRIQRELEMAQQIQRELLPTHFQAIEGYEIAVYWDSANEVAGDFYDCIMLEDRAAMGVIIADVSGKGVPAALFMATTRSLIRGNAISENDPQAMLRQVNRVVIHDAGSSGMFVTLYYALFRAGGEVNCLNAGHNQPLFCRPSSNEIAWLPRGGRALGWFDDLPLEPVAYQLLAGDVIVLYTDGITEAENLAQEPFGEERLAEVVWNATAQGGNATQICDAISAAVSAFTGAAPPFDDRTLVVVKYLG